MPEELLQLLQHLQHVPHLRAVQQGPHQKTRHRVPLRQVRPVLDALQVHVHQRNQPTLVGVKVEPTPGHRPLFRVHRVPHQARKVIQRRPRIPRRHLRHRRLRPHLPRIPLVRHRLRKHRQVLHHAARRVRQGSLHPPPPRLRIPTLPDRTASVNRRTVVLSTSRSMTQQPPPLKVREPPKSVQRVRHPATKPTDGTRRMDLDHKEDPTKRKKGGGYR